MDADSQAAAEVIRALMRMAGCFTRTGQAMSRDYFPHVRSELITDLAGAVLRMGMEISIPGHQIVMETRVDVRTESFAIRGELVLDGESWLDLPQIRTSDARRLVLLLDRYAEELTSPVRWQVTRLMESTEP